MAKRSISADNQANNGRKRTRKRRESPSEVTDGDSSGSFLLKADRMPMQSSTQLKEPFPWDRLPHELRVKILHNLRPRDLDSCRLLNRETFELIRRNERLLERKVIDQLTWSFTKVSARRSYSLGRLSYNLFDAQPSEEESESSEPTLGKFDKIPSSLSEIPTNNDVRCLELVKGWLTNEHLTSISSYLLDVGCQVHTLKIESMCMARITAPVLLQFLRDVAAKTIILSHIECSRKTLSIEVMKLIVSTPCFYIDCFMDSSIFKMPIPINDKVLEQITAHDFKIGSPNNITRRGLKSFIRALGKSKQEIHGKIFARFSLEEVSFSKSPNVSLLINSEEDIIEFWVKPHKSKTSTYIA